MRFTFALLSVLLLSACGVTGTAVYDANDNRAGTVSEDNDDRATIYDVNDNVAGRVRTNDVYDAGDNRVGRIRDDDVIESRDGNRVGAVKDGKRCVNADDNTVGRVAAAIDDQAAGGACLLLFLR